MSPCLCPAFLALPSPERRSVYSRHIPAHENSHSARRKESGAAGSAALAPRQPFSAPAFSTSARVSRKPAPVCRKLVSRRHSTARFSRSGVLVQSLNRADEPLSRAVQSRTDAVQPFNRTSLPLNRTGSVLQPCGSVPPGHGFIVQRCGLVAPACAFLSL